MNTREPEKRKKKESYFCQVSVVLTYKTHTSDFRMKQSSCTSAPSGRQGHTKADLMDRLLLCVHTQICHMLHKRCCSQQYCQHGTTRDQTPDSPSQHSIEPQKQEPPHRRKNSVTDMDNGLASSSQTYIEQRKTSSTAECPAHTGSEKQRAELPSTAFTTTTHSDSTPKRFSNGHRCRSKKTGVNGENPQLPPKKTQSEGN